MEGTQEIGGQYEDYDHEDLVLRRADPDDCDAIINLVMQGEDGIYDRVYSYPKILKLIETAYLAITAIDRDGKIVAFAAFEDYPQVSTLWNGSLRTLSGVLQVRVVAGVNSACLFVGHARHDRREAL